MTTCFKTFLILTAGLILAVGSGCGYRIGARTMMHPQIKTIAVADVKNDTLEPLAAGIMRQQLAAAFQTDGALILKNIGASDCVIYAKITKVDNVTIRSDSTDYDVTYRPAEFRLTVTMEFVVQIPGRGDPLIAKRTVTGYSDYQIFGDVNVSRANALKFACFHAAKMAVQYTTEAW